MMWNLSTIIKENKMDSYNIELGTFGDYLKEDWMGPLGLTAYRLAKDLGISSMALSKSLNGKNKMSDEVCWRLARYFGMSLNFFVNVQAEYSIRNGKDAFIEETKNLPVYNWENAPAKFNTAR